MYMYMDLFTENIFGKHLSWTLIIFMVLGMSFLQWDVFGIR